VYSWVQDVSIDFQSIVDDLGGFDCDYESDVGDSSSEVRVIVTFEKQVVAQEYCVG